MLLIRAAKPYHFTFKRDHTGRIIGLNSVETGYTFVTDLIRDRKSLIQSFNVTS